jgi:hypothetical protein
MAISPKTCAVCGASYQPRSWNNTMTPICSEACKAQRRAGRAKVVLLPCAECGATVECRGTVGLQWARNGRAYCSPACRDRYTSRLSSERMARTNRKHASRRMRERNPMYNPVAREKMRTTLRAMGWQPSVRGGNGKGPTAPQLALACALGWPMEQIVPTRAGRTNPDRLPRHYKLDIANPTLRVAIEVDGGSHCGEERKAQDRKKDSFLRSIGWTVLRFSNREVTGDLAACVRTVLSTTSRLRTITTTSSAAS